MLHSQLSRMGFPFSFGLVAQPFLAVRLSSPPAKPSDQFNISAYAALALLYLTDALSPPPQQSANPHASFRTQVLAILLFRNRRHSLHSSARLSHQSHARSARHRQRTPRPRR